MKSKFLAPIIFIWALGLLQFPTILQNTSLSLKDSENSWLLPHIERLTGSSLNIAMAQNYEKFENLKSQISDTAKSTVQKGSQSEAPEKEKIIKLAGKMPDTEKSAPLVETHIQLNLPGLNQSNANPLAPALPAPTLTESKPESSASNNPVSDLGNAQKIILIGDSMMGDVAYALRRLNSKSSKPIEIENYHKVSTGLSNQTYYDWPRELDKILSKTPTPEKTVLVIFMGTNDAQNIVEDNKILSFGTDSWRHAYDVRAHKLLDVAKQKNISVYWIQIPSPGASRASFAKRLAYVEDAQKSATAAYQNFYYIDTRQQLQNMSNTRQADDIHLNSTGANVVAEKLYAQIRANQHK